MILSVFVLPAPPLHPVTTTILSPFFEKPSAWATSNAIWILFSTSWIHWSPATKPCGLVSNINNGNRPRHKCICLAAVALRVKPMIGHRGRYLDTRCAEYPDVVKTIIADAWLWNEASTAAIAIEFTLSPINRLLYLKLSNSSLW